MTEKEKTELFDKWYDENYDEWAEGEEGIALREELEQAFKGGIAELENKIADIKANCDLAIEGRDVKIMELEQQIEKIKCCENCKYNSYWGNELHCNYGLKEALQEDKLVECNKMNKWEIKEND